MPLFRPPHPIAWLVLMVVFVGGCRLSTLNERPPAPVPLPRFVTGANIRPVGDARRGYGTRKARQTLERLRKLGVNTIGVLLEGHMASTGASEVRPPSRQEVESIGAMLWDANALGFSTVLIPHIYLDDGGPRGSIGSSDPTTQEAWWKSYQAFIDVAADTADRSGTTLLSMGVELKALSCTPDTRAHMLALASRVRRNYHGLLTYNANWDEAADVAFWDALDVAGVNGYFPLVPEREMGAQRVAVRLTEISRIIKKDLLVLEVGYKSSPDSHIRPWEWPTEVSDKVDDAGQAAAWQSVLTHWMPAPGVRGLVIWVIPTDPDDPASEPKNGFNPLLSLIHI